MIVKSQHITAEQNVALKRISKKTERSEAFHVRKALDDYIKKMNKKLK